MGVPGKRMRLGTRSCAECRRRKVRCILPPEQDRCDACRAHGSLCVSQEFQSQEAAGGGNEAVGSVEEVTELKKRLEELETMMRNLPSDQLSQWRSRLRTADNIITAAASSTSSLMEERSTPPSSIAALPHRHIKHDDYESLLDTARISPSLQNSPLISLFSESSIFDPITYTDSTAASSAIANHGHNPGPLAPTFSSRLRQCLAQFAPYLPRPEKVGQLFAENEKFWSIWPPYFYGPSDAERLQPGQVALAQQHFQDVLVSGHPGQTARAICFLALCIQQTPRAVMRATIPSSIRQEELVDIYVDTAQALLQLDTEATCGGTMDGVEAMNLLYKLCINMGKPQRGWYWNRMAITTAICCGLPVRASTTTSNTTVRAGHRRAVLAWSMAWRAERYSAATLGFPSSTSHLHPGVATSESDDADEDPVSRILCFVAVACGKIIDRDQDHDRHENDTQTYALTMRLSGELDDARRRLFPPDWRAAPGLLPLHLDKAEGWHRQSCQITFFTAQQLLHLPYMMRAGRDARFAPSWDAAMRASRDIAVAYRGFRRWPKGGADLCQVMDLRAFTAALVLVVGPWIRPLQSQGMVDADRALVRDVALCLRRAAAALGCRVAEQAVRTLDVLDAASRGVYMADEDYAVMIPYFGRMRINRALFEPGQQQQQQQQQQEAEEQQLQLQWQQQQEQQRYEEQIQHQTGPSASPSGYFNTVELDTSEFLPDLPLGTEANDPGSLTAELCCDWAELGLGYSSTAWDHSFTWGPFFEVGGSNSGI